MGKNISETDLPEDLRKRGLKMIKYALESGKIIVDEYEMQGPEGMEYFEARYIPISKTEVLDIIRDITEKVKTRELLFKSEKMNMIGGLAAGMAHEINNPLGIILQGIQNSIDQFRVLRPGHQFPSQFRT